jgi:hypothetical protein
MIQPFPVSIRQSSIRSAILGQRLELLGALLLIAARHSLFLKASFNKSKYDLTYFCNSVSDIADLHASPRRRFGFPLSRRGKMPLASRLGAAAPASRVKHGSESAFFSVGTKWRKSRLE